MTTADTTESAEAPSGQLPPNAPQDLDLALEEAIESLGESLSVAGEALADAAGSACDAVGFAAERAATSAASALSNWLNTPCR